MRLTFIDCDNCDSTKGIIMSDTHANCVACNHPVSLTCTPVYHLEPEIIHLDEISIQEQDEMPELADWSTCFNVDNIRVAI